MPHLYLEDILTIIGSIIISVGLIVLMVAPELVTRSLMGL